MQNYNDLSRQNNKPPKKRGEECTMEIIPKIAQLKRDLYTLTDVIAIIHHKKLLIPEKCNKNVLQLSVTI